RERSSVDVQIDGNGSTFTTRLSPGGHDMVDITVALVLRIFDRFRSLGSKSLGSDSISQTSVDNSFNDCSIQENIPIPEENDGKCEIPFVDVQMIGNGGEVSSRLSTKRPNVSSSVDVQIHGNGNNVTTRLASGGHDMVDITVVHVLRIFDWLRNLGSNTLRSDSVSQAGLILLHTTADNLFSDGSIEENNPSSQENVRKRKRPSVDVQTIGNGGDVSRRLSTRTHDVLCTTTVLVSTMFNRFRNMCLNTVGSDYTCHADDQDHTGDQQVRTRSLENQALITDHVSVSNVHKRGCLQNLSILCSVEDDVQTETTHGRDVLGYTASSSLMAPVNHAYLCMDLTDCIIRPEIITFSKSSVTNNYQNHVRREYSDGSHCRILHNQVSAINDCSVLGTKKSQNTRQSPPPQTRMYNQTSSSKMYQDDPKIRSRLDWVRNHQNDLRSDYLLGLYDAVSRGIVKEYKLDQRSCYQEHLLEDREIWLTPSDRADIVCRVFEQKVNDFIKILKYERPFGYVIAFLYTIDKIKNTAQIDEYISAKIPDPVEDPRGYKVVTELIIHGPCGPDRIIAKVNSSIGDASTKVGKKHIQKGFKTPTEVRTVNGYVLPTYRAACEALGLLGDDKEWDIAIEESTMLASSVEGKIVLAVASSGFTSLLLRAGRTTYSRFRLPLDLTDDTVCHAIKHNKLANLLIETDLIIWKNNGVGRRLSANTASKKGATKEELIHVSIAESYIWLHFKIYKLKEDMRFMKSGLTNEERERYETFAKWLLDVGNGEIGQPDQQNDEDTSWITNPKQYYLTLGEQGLSELIDFI
nr:DNA helicase [Tanacetum cinerariifolium]